LRTPGDTLRAHARPPGRARGATLAEAVVVLPLFLFTVLVILQAALVFHAKSNLNHATHEAARAGTVQQASLDAIRGALQRALIPTTAAAARRRRSTPARRPSPPTSPPAPFGSKSSRPPRRASPTTTARGCRPRGTPTRR
jgi:hypothetical protein